MHESPHIHKLLWIGDSLKLSEDCENQADVIDYINQYLTITTFQDPEIETCGNKN